MTLYNLVTNNSNAKEKINSFCLLKKPKIGEHLVVLYFDKEQEKCMVWETTSIQEIITKKSGIRIMTRNSTYTFVKYWNTIEEEIVEREVRNKSLRKAKEFAEEMKTKTPMEILEYLMSKTKWINLIA